MESIFYIAIWCIWKKEEDQVFRRLNACPTNTMGGNVAIQLFMDQKYGHIDMVGAPNVVLSLMLFINCIVFFQFFYFNFLLVFPLIKI